MYSRYTIYVTSFIFFFNDTATTEIYTLSLHDALPISSARGSAPTARARPAEASTCCARDRKSTRLNSSHVRNSYAVFCLKKKKKLRTQVFRLQQKKTYIPVHPRQRLR